MSQQHSIILRALKWDKSRKETHRHYYYEWVNIKQTADTCWGHPSALTCMWGSADTMHTQWQVPGQNLGQESGLTTSVKVNWRPGPSCRHERKTIRQLKTVCEQRLTKEITLAAIERIEKWTAASLESSYGIIFSAASLAWRSWERVNPTASTTARLCLWFWKHTHRNIKRAALTLLHLCGIS